MEQKEKKRNSLNNEDNKIINNDINNKNDINNNSKNIVYKIFIKVYDDEKKKVLEKNLIINNKSHYILDLDKLYTDIISTLNIMKINCRFGLDYKINNFEIQKNIRKINLLEYEVQGFIKPKNDYKKELEMEINIISDKNISEEEALLNPQLFIKNDKKYKIDPTLDILNKSNLFKYDKGLEIFLGKLSILFKDNNTYDLTNVNLDEICYDGDKGIYFDEKNFNKEKSSFKKLWDKNVCLIYNLSGKEDNNNINDIKNYLIKRYSSDFYEMSENKIMIMTKIGNLFMKEKN